MPEHKDKTFDEAAPETKINLLWDGQKELHLCIGRKFEELRQQVAEVKSVANDIKKQCGCRPGQCNKIFVTRKQGIITAVILLLVSVGAITIDLNLAGKILHALKLI